MPGVVQNQKQTYRLNDTVNSLQLGVLSLFGILTVPATLPVVSPEAAADSPILDLNDALAEELGWPEMVDQVAAVLDDLPAGEERTARVLTASYGEAAAVEILGPEEGIPEGSTISAHNGYADWWPDDAPAGTVVAVRYRVVTLEPYFASCEQVDEVHNDLDVDNEVAGTPIVVCRDLTVTPEDLRDALRHAD